MKFSKNFQGIFDRIFTAWFSVCLCLCRCERDDRHLNVTHKRCGRDDNKQLPQTHANVSYYIYACSITITFISQPLFEIPHSIKRGFFFILKYFFGFNWMKNSFQFLCSLSFGKFWIFLSIQFEYSKRNKSQLSDYVYQNWLELQICCVVWFEWKVAFCLGHLKLIESHTANTANWRMYTWSPSLFWCTLCSRHRAHKTCTHIGLVNEAMYVAVNSSVEWPWSFILDCIALSFVLLTFSVQSREWKINLHFWHHKSILSEIFARTIQKDIASKFRSKKKMTEREKINVVSAWRFYYSPHSDSCLRSLSQKSWRHSSTLSLQSMNVEPFRNTWNRIIILTLLMLPASEWYFIRAVLFPHRYMKEEDRATQ